MTQKFPDAHALLAWLREGKNSAGEIAEASLSRIAERDDLIGAWAYCDPDAVRMQAAALDAGSHMRGPLHGVPIGIKDVLLTRDMPTRYNSPLFDKDETRVDAAAVAMLRQAGAIILGKTETVELASIGNPPGTRNPHAPDHTPGGSSSGSAAAVADGHVPIALGTQTGGSIIRPASFCGVWALKPTWGMVSTEGAKPFAPSLDTIGWFARSPDDLRLMLEVLAPLPIAAKVERDPADCHFAIWRTAAWDRAEQATRDAMDDLIARLRRAGARLTELDLPDPFDRLAKAHWTVMLKEGQRSFLADYRRDADKLHPRIGQMVRDGGGFSDEDYLEAMNLAAEARRSFDLLAAEFDGVILPSTIAEAPPGLTSTGDLIFNGLLTLLHVPCINMPLFKAPNGLPVGLTLTGPRYSDARITEIAAIIGAVAL